MQPRKKIVFNQINRTALLLSFWLLSLQLLAQEDLTGRWDSYSESFRNKELTTKDKRDQIVIIFNDDMSYRKFSYLTNEEVRLSYNALEGKLRFRDANEKVLRRKKVKERGTYQVKENEIVFFTGSEKYFVHYELSEGVLHLKQFDQDASITDLYVIKFKRAK